MPDRPINTTGTTCPIRKLCLTLRKKYQLTATSHIETVIILASETPPITKQRLADLLHSSTANITGITQRLSRIKVIEVTRSSRDQRSHLLSLTPLGKQAAKLASEILTHP